MISVFRRFCYTVTVCGAPKLRLRKLICFAYEKAFIRLLTACAAQRIPADTTRTDVHTSSLLGLCERRRRLQ